MVIIAIDSFKGSLSSVEACQIVKNAIMDSTDREGKNSDDQQQSD